MSDIKPVIAPKCDAVRPGTYAATVGPDRCSQERGHGGDHRSWQCSWIDTPAPVSVVLQSEYDELRAENERLRIFIESLTDPDVWEHVGESQWLFHGYPPFETAAALLGAFDRDKRA